MATIKDAIKQLLTLYYTKKQANEVFKTKANKSFNAMVTDEASFAVSSSDGYDVISFTSTEIPTVTFADDVSDKFWSTLVSLSDTNVTDTHYLNVACGSKWVWKDQSVPDKPASIRATWLGSYGLLEKLI